MGETRWLGAFKENNSVYFWKWELKTSLFR
jgi:hypothetical protein